VSLQGLDASSWSVTATLFPHRSVAVTDSLVLRNRTETDPAFLAVALITNLSGGGLVVSDEAVVALRNILLDTDHYGFPHHSLHLLSSLLALRVLWTNSS